MRVVTTQAEMDAAGKEWVAVQSGTYNASDNSHVEAWDNSHVVAWGNSHVEAWGNSHVVASGNSHVEASGNSHVELYDFAMSHITSSLAIVRAISPCAVAVTVKYPDTIEEWLALKGLSIEEGCVNLWKAVRADGTDWHSGKINYLTGNEVLAPDWDPAYLAECGLGLHLADSPEAALSFVTIDNRSASRLLRVRVRIDDCRVFGGQPEYPCKLRARACTLVEEVAHQYQSQPPEEAV